MNDLKIEVDKEDDAVLKVTCQTTRAISAFRESALMKDYMPEGTNLAFISRELLNSFFIWTMNYPLSIESDIIISITPKKAQ